MRIACDLDGTLADMTAALYREAEALFGTRFEARADVPLPKGSAEDAPAAPLDLDAMSPSATSPADPSTKSGSSSAPPAGQDSAEEQRAEGNTAVAVMREAPAAEAGPAADASATADAKASTDADDEGDEAARGLTPTQQRRLWQRVREVDDFWAGLSEIEPGAVARLGALANEHQWEVLFVTQRPPSAGDRAQVQSQRWLEAHGFDYPSVFVVTGSRGRIADALHLDVVIDDRPENCLDVALESRALAILVWRDDPALVPAALRRHGIEVVSTFADALAMVLQIHEGRARGRGVFGSLRRALGL